MASILNIQMKISADDKASGPLGKIQDALGGVSDSAKKGFSGLQDIVGGALVGAGAAGVAAIAGIGAAAFDVSQNVSNTASSIQSDLGVTADEAKRFADIAAAAWGDNFYGSIEEAGAAIVEVRKQLGDMPDDELQRVAENAARLGDSFEMDAGESINTVKTLMEEFGLTSDQAFDFITKGMQSGLNANDDFIDSIGEYSNLFADAGFDAGQFFSIMETGQAGGVLGTDKIADSVKEMGIILSEGGDDAKAAFDLIGLSFDDIAAAVASGDSDWADYFDEIVGGLAGIEDPMKRQQAQVALFGTMAEDMGVSFTDGLSSATTALDDMAGATGTLDARYNTLGDAVEGFKRRGLLALQPIGDVLVDLANRAMPFVEDAFAWFETDLAPMLEMAVGFVTTFASEFVRGWEATKDPLFAIEEALDNFLSEDQLAAVWDFNDGLRETWNQITTLLTPVIDAASQFVEWNDVLMAVGVVVASIVIPALVGIVAAAAPVIAVGAALVGAIALARNAWENDWGGIQEKVGAVVAWFQSTIPAWLESLRLWWEENGAAIMTTAENAWNFISSVVETAWTVISETFSAFKAAFEGDWDAFGTHLGTAFGTAWGFIQQTLADAGDWLLEKMAEIVLNLIATVQEVDWMELGRSIIDGIGKGITAFAGKLADIARNAVAAAVQAAKEQMGIGSPSKVTMREIGMPFTEGIAIGMMKTSPIDDAISRLSAVMVNPLQSATAAISSGGISYTGGGGGGASPIYITVDARGSTLTEAQIEAAVQRGLDAAGRQADARIRTGQR